MLSGATRSTGSTSRSMFGRASSTTDRLGPSGPTAAGRTVVAQGQACDAGARSGGPGNAVALQRVPTVVQFPAVLGASVSVIAGLLGLIWPQRVSTVIGLQLPGPLGISEFRATYGGLFVGAGAAVLSIGTSDAALVLGAAWLGAFAARVLSLVIDRNASRENLAGCAIELAVGSLLVLGR